jgi:hypothetical protein
VTGSDSAFLRLSAQRALLGAVGRNVLGVCVALEGDRLLFRGYVGEHATEDEREALDFAASEMLADFPDVGSLDLEIEQADATALPGCGGQWVFLGLGARAGAGTT